MKKKLVKIGFLLLGISIIHVACKKEINESPPAAMQMLSKEEVMNYLGKEDNSLKPKNYDENYVTPDFNKITYEKISNSSQLMTVIPATTIYPEHYSRILLVKVNQEINAVIFSMYAAKGSPTNKFTGEILITDLHGSFINGFRVSDGVIKTQFKKKINAKSSFTSMSTSVLNNENVKGLMIGGGICPNHGECFERSSCIECLQYLDEVIVYDSLPRNFINVLYVFYMNFVTNHFSNEGWDFGYGGGSSQNQIPPPCGPGYTKNANTNECTLIPCPGDPVSNPEIAPQTNSGVQGGLHNTCARVDPRKICYGKVGHGLHDGVDIKNDEGNPIYAMHDGDAVINYQDGGAGHYVRITSTIKGDKVALTYFHLKATDMKSGSVQAGDIIGYQGRSGNLDNAIKKGYAISHVHVKARKNGIMANPLDYFVTKIDPKTGKVLNPCL
jgi:hypothetical protein